MEDPRMGERVRRELAELEEGLREDVREMREQIPRDLREAREELVDSAARRIAKAKRGDVHSIAILATLALFALVFAAIAWSLFAGG